MHKKLSLLVLLAATSSIANAGPALDKFLTKYNAKLIRTTDAAIPGMKAHLVEGKGKQRVLYESADGQSVFYGMPFDANANNMLAIDSFRLGVGAQPSASTSSLPATNAAATKVSSDYVTPQIAQSTQALLNKAANAHWVKEGRGRVVYVIFNPNCPFCKQLHQATRSTLEDVEIRWVPIGIVQDDSYKKAVSALRNPSQLRNGIDTVSTVEPRADELIRLRDNMYLIEATGSRSVPTIIWDGGVQVGVPTESEMKKIFGKS